jgi:WD40 repeat protein
MMAHVWNVATGQRRLSLSGHVGYVYGVAFSPNGQRLATCGGDGTVRIWEAASGRQLLRVQAPDAMRSVAFSPDGRFLAACGMDQLARVWDAGDGSERLVLKGHEGPVTSLVFDPAGRLILTGGWDRTIRSWDAGTGRPLEVFRGHLDNITGLAVRPDGRVVASASFDRTARLWPLDAKNASILARRQAEAGDSRPVSKTNRPGRPPRAVNDHPNRRHHGPRGRPREGRSRPGGSVLT